MSDMWPHLQRISAELGHQIVVSHTRRGIVAQCSCGFRTPRFGSEDQAHAAAYAQHMKPMILEQRDTMARRRRLS